MLLSYHTIKSLIEESQKMVLIAVLILDFGWFGVGFGSTTAPSSFITNEIIGCVVEIMYTYNIV